MGRRLTSYERSIRDNERRERAAARRQETANRRAREKEIRDRIKSREKAEKAAQTDKEIAENRKRVSNYDNYLNTLEKLHIKHDLKKFENNYENRLKRKSYKSANFEKGNFQITPFKKNPFKPTPFKKKRFKSNLDNSGIRMDDEVTGGFMLLGAALGLYFFWGSWENVIGAGLIGFFGPAVIANYFNEKIEKKKRKERTKHNESEAKKKIEHDKKQISLKAKYDESEAKRKIEHDKKQISLKAKYDESEAKRKEDFIKKDKSNKQKFDKNEENRILILTKARENNIESIEEILEAALPINYQVNCPEDFVLGTIKDYEVGYNVVDSDKVDLLILLPDIDDIIPIRKISVTPNGKTVKQGELSNKARNELYDKFMNSLAFDHAIEVLRCYPFLNNIRLEAFLNTIDPKTGGDAEKIMLKVNFEKEVLYKLQLDRIDPVIAIENFEHSFQPCGRKYKTIEPDINREEIVWSTIDNKGFEIPDGLNPN